MATFTAVFGPKSATGGLNDVQVVTNLATTTASSTLTLNNRNMVAISVVPGSTAGATIGATVRFSSSTGAGSATATSGDFSIPLNTVVTFEMGDEFNQLSFFNPNATGTVTISVMRLNRNA